MPERAAETSQVSDDTREELLAKTAGEWPAAARRRRAPAGGPGPGGRRPAWLPQPRTTGSSPPRT